MSLVVPMVLAQATMPETTAPGPFALPDIPTQDQIVDAVVNLSQGNFGAVMAMMLFACGLVYMLQGWKLFRILIIANAAVLGAVVGAYVGGMLRGANTWLYTGIAGCLLLAVLAWPLMKYAISLMGGLAGSFLGYGLWFYVTHTIDRPELMHYAWVGALIGLITLGLLAFVVLKAVIIIITSFQGSIMTSSGIIALLMKYEPLRESLETPLRQNTHLVALLVAVPALIGIAFQYSAGAAKGGKKKPDGGG